MTLAIKVENLIKNYGQNTVIKGISFDVKKGEVFALLGTNGAGKTTTLECIEGLRKYESGKVSIDGNFGVQLQSSSLPANIKVIEAFTLFCKWNKSNIDPSIFESLGLSVIKNKQYGQLSTGQKRRLHLALGLIGNPDIIFLDEPTAGLDVEGRAALHEQIRKLKCNGKTIVLSSHDMNEIENLCDRLAILKDGKIAYIGTARELTTQIHSKIRLQIKTGKPLKKTDFVHSTYVETENDYHTFITTNISDVLIELLTFLKSSFNPVLDIRIVHQSLEESFLDIAKEGK
ncbi:ABC transporter ATP-binding protein [Clostridium sp. JN-1]|jgi:ABC-2 type transport system ATP-binding protein|uniref:ABC transporter ATP-binding protein n=1 Tax=Clostridium sp. JN-1 TaxID=2483110 RepID=UPI000F0B2E18|nr:ABC transporter ATP-binding protein [Clostridium sp. JN-1]